jgi:hypothetical protein
VAQARFREPIRRELVVRLERALRGKAPLLQVVLGPRQVGKTTAVQQLLDGWAGPHHYATADLPAPPDPSWIQVQWQLALSQPGRGRRLLVLDEIQKVPRWSEALKALLDADRRSARPLKVIVLGSSSLLMQRSLPESLAGRFELQHATHWTFAECRAAFGWNLDRWLYFGGYPGAAPLIRNPARWADYVRDSLIETVLGRDVLQLAPVNKPALLRQLFQLACRRPAEVLSYTKMLGQLHDAGNTTTLAHYLELLRGAFLVSGLERFTPSLLRQRGSSPKLIAWNNALISAQSGLTLAAVKSQPELWGRWVENAVGAHLIGHAAQRGYTIFYFREGNDEVDFVVQLGDRIVALEVKIGARPPRGLAPFLNKYPHAKPLLIGPGGLELEAFFIDDRLSWLA